MENDILIEDQLIEERLDTKLPKEKELFKTKKEPRKALSNFQRNQYRALFNSMALSDRKSMILVRINTALLSVLIVFHSYIVQNIPLGYLIEITAIVGTGISLISGLLSSKTPGFLIQRILKKQILPKYPDLKYNVLMSFTNPSLEEYENAMDKVVRNQELQIGNQVRSSYLYNQILMRQYRLLEFSYNAFIVTIISVIVLFLVGLVKLSLM